MVNISSFEVGGVVLVSIMSCVKLDDRSFPEMVNRLVEMSKPVTNDERQNKYCDYIMLFLSHFGNERCMVVGSTQEQTRLRIRQDEGDYDYLLISEISIPEEAFIYRDDLPCFVNINGQYLKQIFPAVELVDGIYLPASLLNEISVHAFKHLRTIFQIVSRVNSRREDEGLLVSIDHQIKPGKSLVSYREVDCPELEIDQKHQDINEISKYLKDSLKKESLDDKDSVICKFAMVVKEFEKIEGKERKSDFLQSFGPVMDAALNMCYKNEDSEEKQNIKVQQHSTESSKYSNTDICEAIKTFKRFKDNSVAMNKQDSTLLFAAAPFVDIVNEFCNANLFFREIKEPNESSRDQQEDHDDTCTRDSCENPGKPGLVQIRDTILRYKSKSSKDFIPVFKINGKPKFLDEWMSRKRNWPPRHVLEDIYNSEFFVVAKPALVKGDRQKDFCLSFNVAEIKLAKAMTPVQFKVVLILKAIKKGVLQEYSDTLTSFHWKTVVYWMSESSSVSEQEDTSDNVMNFLLMVIDYMLECLTKRRLEHFFIPSNLFEGMDGEVLDHLITKITSIRENPIESLKQFFSDENLFGWKQDIIPADKMEIFRRAYNDPREVDKIELVMTILKTFSNEPRAKVKEALRNVLVEGLPYFIEEESRGRDKDDLVPSLIQGLVLQGNLIDLFLDYIMDPMDKKEEEAKQIAEQFYDLIVKNVLKKNTK